MPLINNLDEYLEIVSSQMGSFIEGNTDNIETVLIETLKAVIKAKKDIPVKVRYLLLFCIEVKKEMIDGRLVISVGFDRIGVHKPSLYPEGYPDGADIDVIFNNGWHAKNYVYGSKFDTALPHISYKKIRSIKDFNYTHFIQETIDKAAAILNIDKKQFYINDIYMTGYSSCTHGVGNYRFL